MTDCWLWSPWTLLVDILLGILLIEYALYKTYAPRHIDEARDSKYSAFRRTDVKEWKRWRLYLASPFTFPRFAITLFQVVYHVPIAMLVLHG